MKKYLIGAVAAATLALGGGAHAATSMYELTLSSAGCCNLADYGTVTVTDISGGFNISVVLADGVDVNANGNGTHHALDFDLTGTGITLSNFSTPLIAGSGAIGNASPFGAFTNSVVFTGGHGNPTNLSSFSFDAKGTNLALGSTAFNGTNLFFVADVFANGLTGNVASPGGGGGGGVPEPASWALMILGFGGVGAVLRTRRQRMVVA